MEKVPRDENPKEPFLFSEKVLWTFLENKKLWDAQSRGQGGFCFANAARAKCAEHTFAWRIFAKIEIFVDFCYWFGYNFYQRICLIQRKESEVLYY